MNVAYRFDAESKLRIPVDKIRSLIALAFDDWAQETNLDFYEVSNNKSADIVITFEGRYKEYYNTFLCVMSNDALAHAFPPGKHRVSGDIHVSEFIIWDYETLTGQTSDWGLKSFFTTILHEIGHSLGLGHSKDENALMYPYESPFNNRITEDDSKAIQILYGKPKRGQLIKMKN